MNGQSPPAPFWYWDKGDLAPRRRKMLKFCGKHNITADVEVISIQK